MASQSCHEKFIIFMFFVLPLFSAASSQDKSKKCNFISVKDLCQMTLYPISCQNSLPNTTISKVTNTDQLQAIFNQSAHVALTAVSKISLDFSKNGTFVKLVAKNSPHNKLATSALNCCQTLFSLAIDNIKKSIDSSREISSSSPGARDDIRTWLSAAGTDLQTCLDGFDDNIIQDVRKAVREKMVNSTEYISNSLAMITRIDLCLGSTTPKTESNKLDFPYWLMTSSSNETRRLLGTSPGEITPNLVVAKDGSGNFTVISDALKAVPDNSLTRFVIYVKKGIYDEKVIVDNSKWNVMMIGDGPEETIVTGNRSADDGFQTFDTASFAAFGRGFIAQSMGFRNTAIKSQAVALLSTSDQSVFYKCLIDSKQDTLYPQSNRQFYRECNISGTIDFIFGDAGVVFQKTNIWLKRPLPGQANVITAQGKIDPNSNTGISIQNCNISAAEDLTGVLTFLGRPWRDFSTAVFMQSDMDGSIDPRGWSPYHSDPPPSTISYGEYENRGVGANVSGRVTWPGVKANLSCDEAEKFTVGDFIKGGEWLPETGVPFDTGLQFVD